MSDYEAVHQVEGVQLYKALSNDYEFNFTGGANAAEEHSADMQNGFGQVQNLLAEIHETNGRMGSFADEINDRKINIESALDGQFKQGMQETVKAYQASRGIQETGNIGPETKEALMSEFADRYPEEHAAGKMADTVKQAQEILKDAGLEGINVVPIDASKQIAPCSQEATEQGQCR